MKSKKHKPTARVALKSKSLAAAAPPGLTGIDIGHAVLEMVQNPSFNHLLGSMKSVYPDLVGIDPANPGVNQEGTTSYPQNPDAQFILPYGVDPKHVVVDVREQINFNGAFGGFVHNFIRNYQDKQASDLRVTAYLDPQGATRLPALHTLAESFTICDHRSSSVPGQSWPNRFFVHSGTSNGWVNTPTLFYNWHDDDQVALYDRLNEQNISCTVCFDDISQSLLLEHQRLANNKSRYEFMSAFYPHARGPDEEFPKYAFIEPFYFGGYENDRHPPANMLEDEVLTSKVYNSIRANAALRQKTLLVIFHDQHGRFYDQVLPPIALPPDDKAGDGFDFKQYGLRVPALLIRPYAPKGVPAEVFDHTSLQRCVSDKWGLGPFGARTAAANSFAGVLLSEARTDKPAIIPQPSTKVAASPALLAVASRPQKAVRKTGKAAPPRPMNDLQVSLLTFSQRLDAKIKESASKKVRRVRRSMKSAEDHTAVAKEQVKKFLAQHRSGAMPFSF